MMTKKWWMVLTCVALAAMLVWAFQDSETGQARQLRETPFNGDRAFQDLTTIVGFGPRPAGSDALARTREYILDELRKAGLEPQVDEFEAITPHGPKKMANIRAARAGTRPNLIILAGHYDTKLYDFPFVGASDGGSSTAWLLEMARATADLRLDNTLEFLFFDGEEAVVEWTDTDSLYGSRFDVDRRAKAGSLRQIGALVLVDMIGDKNLNIKQEYDSTDWINAIIWNTAHSMGFMNEFPNQVIGVADDHVPYLRAGIAAVDIIDFDYPYWHTAEDTLDKTSAQSLKIVGDVIYASLPEIDRRVSQP